MANSKRSATLPLSGSVADRFVVVSACICPADAGGYLDRSSPTSFDFSVSWPLKPGRMSSFKVTPVR